ncbi:MAG: DNA repair protein RadA [Clostridia bacterium]|nr:DNA repair protein RadA [Clostridia bacterium]
MKTKTIYYCTECGYESAKWLGKCPACNSWNSFSEEITTTGNSKGASKTHTSLRKNTPSKLADVSLTKEERILSGISELDRVLGGGIVKGSLVLVGGDPGIGKSTLLLQLVKSLDSATKVFYVSGEESEKQLKMRADRLDIHSDELMVLAETDISSILTYANELAPDVLIIDSVQTMYNPEITSAPGSVSQVRDVTLSLMKLAKETGTAVFVVGHVTKDGAIAGPKVLEHMVDCVLYFEGERHQSFRLLRAVKNRFGSTNEIGVFDMTGDGLKEVKNPSLMLLEGRPDNSSGSSVVCTLEGTRPVLAEIQALVSPTGFGMPRRMATGMDYNRVNLLIAVLEKRVGLNLQNQDSYVNIVGGFRLDEPAVDLGVIVALASSFKNISVDKGLAVIGEVGLTGELRAVNQLEKRLLEIKKLGFTSCIIPYANSRGLDKTDGLTVYTAKNVTEALGYIF